MAGSKRFAVHRVRQLDRYFTAAPTPTGARIVMDCDHCGQTVTLDLDRGHAIDLRDVLDRALKGGVK